MRRPPRIRALRAGSRSAFPTDELAAAREVTRHLPSVRPSDESGEKSMSRPGGLADASVPLAATDAIPARRTRPTWMSG